jgi:hypothetical protein
LALPAVICHREIKEKTMPIVYSEAVKNSRLQAVVDAIGAAGVLVIGTSALSGATGVLVSIPLATASFTVASGAMSLTDLPRTATASATGIAAKAEIRTSGGTVVMSGLTVGISGTDVIINSTAISSGQTVQATVGTITHG